MTLLETIHGLLVANAGVTALVGSSPARIYLQLADQGAAAPRLVLTLVTDLPENSLDGGADDRLRVATVQVDSYARGYRQAHELADAVNAVLAALVGSDLSATLEIEQDLYDDETSLHRVRQDYRVSH